MEVVALKERKRILVTTVDHYSQLQTVVMGVKQRLDVRSFYRVAALVNLSTILTKKHPVVQTSVFWVVPAYMRNQT